MRPQYNPHSLGAVSSSSGGQRGVAYFNFDQDSYDELEPALPAVADGTRRLAPAAPGQSRAVLYGIVIGSTCTALVCLAVAFS